MLFYMAAALDEEISRRVRDTIKRVVLKCGGSHKEAAGKLDVAQPRWNAMTEGERPLCLHRLASHLGEELKWFCVEWLRVEGLPRDLETTQPVIAAIQRLDLRKREIA